MCIIADNPPTKFEWTLELIARLKENQNKQRDTLCKLEIALRHKDAVRMTQRDLEKMRHKVRHDWIYNPKM